MSDVCSKCANNELGCYRFDILFDMDQESVLLAGNQTDEIQVTLFDCCSNAIDLALYDRQIFIVGI